MSKNRLYHGDCLDALRKFKTGKFSLIYIDPPFNTGKLQTKTTLRTKQSHVGTRRGFGKRLYQVTALSKMSWCDSLGEDYLPWLERCLVEAHRVLMPQGAILVHLDWHSVYEVKCFLMDPIFGKKSFMNEIIWAYDFGGRSKKFWARKHDTILWYVKNPEDYIFNYAAIDRIPYMAPGLAGAEKAARGKCPTDVFWQTIVPTNSKEKTGYPTQKPLKFLQRLVAVHSQPRDWCLDFCAGSGTFGEACGLQNRRFVLVDSNPEAIPIQLKRLHKYGVKIIRI